MPHSTDQIIRFDGPLSLIGEPQLVGVHPNYHLMSFDWQKIADLTAGVDRMREATTDYLPVRPQEDKDHYAHRVANTELYPGVTRAINRVKALPFSEPVGITGAFPESLENFIDDVDDDGTNITLFTRNVTEDAALFGLTHILTDFPKMIQDGSGEQAELSKAEEAERDSRPRMLHIKVLKRMMTVI